MVLTQFWPNIGGDKLGVKRRFIGLIGKKMCTPKKKGGIGFRDFDAFNLIMLAK